MMEMLSHKLFIRIEMDVKMYFYDEVGESIESLCKYEKAWKSS